MPDLLEPDEDEVVEIEFGCCICGERVAKPEILKVILDAGEPGEDDDKWQVFWAHFKCVNIALHPEYADEIREEIKNTYES